MRQKVVVRIQRVKIMLIIPTTSALYKREYFSLMMKEEASMCVVGCYLGNPKLMSKQSAKDRCSLLLYFSNLLSFCQLNVEKYKVTERGTTN